MADAPVLQVLVEQLRRARGIEHRKLYLELKRYLAEMDDDEFERQIKAITELWVFNYLLYLGLPWHRQVMLTKLI